jgi:hypothetical protein
MSCHQGTYSESPHVDSGAPYVRNGDAFRDIQWPHIGVAGTSRLGESQI